MNGSVVVVDAPEQLRPWDVVDDGSRIVTLYFGGPHGMDVAAVKVRYIAVALGTDTLCVRDPELVDTPRFVPFPAMPMTVMRDVPIAPDCPAGGLCDHCPLRR